jgi:hypothetical protein
LSALLWGRSLPVGLAVGDLSVAPRTSPWGSAPAQSLTQGRRVGRGGDAAPGVSCEPPAQG